MSLVYFISDLHLGHKNILNFSGEYREGSTVEEHDQILKEKWNSVVRKRDTVYTLGDIAFSQQKLKWFGEEFNGNKILVRGNHDKMHIRNYLQCFSDIHGVTKYKGYWLSHAPIHPDELYGKKNIHGHTHFKVMQDNGIVDERYINVSIEMLNGYPKTLDQLIEGKDAV